ncbi:MAG: cytidine/deoxycytidylate deaminase family protein [Candidatus Omnitrophica bacterium]|jgi:dCMP deaminase|nr:cytidine/deoxycytidylate deaminase family protein [Candidatus Omnitrophota bacterium]MDD5080534.1 cytidine/deoxycytidylate deaminase family protein [Candidatus Omnitrophota bacterium]MDD5441374.1 cytidine/deoxycytidylate deaminase family protein [Candidatus Omnitrophota bacterium]
MNGNNIERPEWDDYFMGTAFLISKRSTCLRRKVGAVLVRDNRILATGYNGAPSKVEHCDVKGCLRQELNVPSGQRHEICRGLHAEQNVFLQAAKFGVSANGSTLYITNTPCSICAKMIINAGISEVVFADAYPDQMADGFLKEAKIKVRQYKPKEER